jgi:hypothetical protein
MLVYFKIQLENDFQLYFAINRSLHQFNPVEGREVIGKQKSKKGKSKEKNKNI